MPINTASHTRSYTARQNTLRQVEEASIMKTARDIVVSSPDRTTGKNGMCLKHLRKSTSSEAVFGVNIFSKRCLADATNQHRRMELPHCAYD